MQKLQYNNIVTINSKLVKNFTYKNYFTCNLCDIKLIQALMLNNSRVTAFFVFFLQKRFSVTNEQSVAIPKIDKGQGAMPLVGVGKAHEILCHLKKAIDFVFHAVRRNARKCKTNKARAPHRRWRFAMTV